MRTFFTVFLGGLAGVAAIFLLRLGGFGSAIDEVLFHWLGRNNLSTVVSSDGSQLFGLVLAFVIAWVALDIPKAGQRWLIAGLTILLLATGSLVLSMHGVIFSPLAPMLGTFVGFVCTSALARIGPGAHRRRVDSIFGSSVSRKTLSALHNGPAGLVKTPRKTSASVVTLVATNHPSLMEAMPAEDFTAMNRMYFSMAADYLCEAGAFIETSSASGLRAVFGVPIASEDPAPKACRSALELIRRLERLNLEADSRFHHLLEFHAGIATGEVLCGDYGTPRAQAYAVAGTPMAASSRLAAAGAVYGSRLIACMETHKLAQDLIEVRPIDLLQDSEGKDSEIYEVLCAKGGLSSERQRSRDHFWNGVNHTRARRWDDAIAEFSKARIKGIPDPALDFYLRRIENQRNARSAPELLLPLA